MTAHSPTPWTNGVNRIRDANGRLIAWLGYGRRGISQKVTAEEQAANARLIAAAPDLYEALNHVAQRWDKYDEKDAPRLGEEIRAAVAKAEGHGSAGREVES